MRTFKGFILSNKKTILLSILIALLLRFWLMIFITPASHGEIISWQNAATVFDEGRNIYLKQPDNGFYYNYLPLWHIFLWILLEVSIRFGLVFGYLVKTFLILFDIVVLILLYKIAVNVKGIKYANIISLIFALSPVSLFIVSFGGQFEPFATIFMLLAIYYFLSGKTTGKKLYLSALLLGIGILIKIFPVFILPLFLIKLNNNKLRLKYFAIACSPSIIFAIPYLTSFASISGMIKYIALYKGKNSFGWGISRVFLVPALLLKTWNLYPALLSVLESIIALLKSSGAILMLAALIPSYFMSKDLDLIEGSGVVFYSIIFSLVYLFPHYLYWGLPFLLLMPRKRNMLYFLFSSIYTAVYILSFVLGMAIGDPQDINWLAVSWTVSGFLVWVVCAYTFFFYLVSYLKGNKTRA